MYIQDAPFAIQIELTEGCNLLCGFCGMNGIRKRPGDYKFLTLKNAITIAGMIHRLGWRSRIEFAMHGEPTANPKTLSIVRAFKQRLPDNQLTLLTNGTWVAADPLENIGRLFAAGLSVLAIDDYGHRSPARIKAALKFDNKPFYFYPTDSFASPHKIWGRSGVVIFIEDIRKAKKGGHSLLNNHCGSATPPLRTPLEKRCAKPFRELAIRWDGNVALCCNDFHGIYKCGNVLEESIATVWLNKYFTSARKFLMLGERSAIYPCRICDAISYRVGLLPDRFGKETMPEPTKLDTDIVSRASKGDSYTTPVERHFKTADNFFA